MLAALGMRWGDVCPILRQRERLPHQMFLGRDAEPEARPQFFAARLAVAAARARW